MNKKLTYLSVLSIFYIGLTSINAQNDKEILPKALSYFASSNSFTSLGNFASLSTKSNTLNASFFFLTENRSMYNISVNAGATQGISTLFDEGKLNSNVSIGLEYRLLFNRKIRPFAGYNLPDLDMLKLREQDVEEEYNKKKINLLSRIEHLSNKVVDSTDRTQFQLIGSDLIDIKLHSRLVGLLQSIDAVVNKYDAMSMDEFAKQDKTVQILVKQLKEFRAEVVKRVSLKGDAVYVDELIKINEKRLSKINKINSDRNALKPDFVRLNFISFGYKATNNSFVRFIDSLEESTQLKGTDYISHNLSITYNFISNIKEVKYDSSGSIVNFNHSNYKFLTIGAEYSLANNQSSLTQVEVVDLQYENDDSTRKVSKTQNAFMGEYLEDLSGLNVFLDYYAFFSKKSNFLAYHINPALVIQENQKPITTLQLGLLIPFKKKEDNKTSVNVEIFYKIKDIFNTTNNANSLLNRNVIGIQTSFPFNI